MAVARPRPTPATRSELIRKIARAEMRLRELASRWWDSLPARVRYELLLQANALLRILLREPKRPRRPRRRAARRGKQP